MQYIRKMIPLGRKTLSNGISKNKSSVLLSHYHQLIQLLSNQMFCTCLTLLSNPSLPHPGLQVPVSGTQEDSADAV